MSGPLVAAVVPAAGRGDRLGSGEPKAFRLLAGEPMLVHAVRALAASRVDLIVVAAPPGECAQVSAMLAGTEGADLIVVDGGPSRSASVRRALVDVPPSVQVVLVHDAARPLAPASLVDAVVAAVDAGADAVVPVLAVADTVKRVTGSAVVETVDRSQLRAVQTPQGFRRDVLDAAYADTADDATDDAGHVERIGRQVVVVPGAEEAFKVTRPIDLLLAEAVLAGRRADA